MNPTFYRYLPKPEKIYLHNSKILYYSPCKFRTALSAATYLALTYAPKIRVPLSFKNSQPAETPPATEISKGSGTWYWYNQDYMGSNYIECFKGLRRVWASFGRCGGGWEFTAIGDFVINSHTNLYCSKYEIGTPPKSYSLYEGSYGNMVYPGIHWTEPSYILLVVLVATAKAAAVEISATKDRPVSVKVAPYGVSIHFWGIEDETREQEYSISVALKRGHNQPPGFKVWGTTWKDESSRDKSQSIRWLNPFLTMQFPDHEISECLANETFKIFRKRFEKKLPISYIQPENLDQTLFSQIMVMRNRLIDHYGAKGKDKYTVFQIRLPPKDPNWPYCWFGS